MELLTYKYKPRICETLISWMWDYLHSDPDQFFVHEGSAATSLTLSRSILYALVMRRTIGFYICLSVLSKLRHIQNATVLRGKKFVSKACPSPSWDMHGKPINCCPGDILTRSLNHLNDVEEQRLYCESLLDN